MKKFLFVILTAILLLTFSSCKKEETTYPEGMTYSENGAADYYFYYPEEWILDRNDGMVSVRVSDTDHSNVSVTTFNAPADVTDVEAYMKDTYLGYVKENFPDIEFVTENGKITLGGLDARQNIFTATVAGEKYKFRQIFTYRNGYIDILTYTSTEEGFDTHFDEVEKIIKEFKFK